MHPLWTQPLHTSASIPLDYASKGYVDGVLAIPDSRDTPPVRSGFDLPHKYWINLELHSSTGLRH